MRGSHRQAEARREAGEGDLIREAVVMHVEGLIEDGQPIPEPASAVGYAEVAVAG